MNDALDTACRFLDSLHRFELSLLLRECSIAIKDIKEGRFVDDDWFGNVHDEIVLISAPAPLPEAFDALPPEDRKRIAEAVSNAFHHSRTFDDIRTELTDGAPRPIAGLVAELMIHRGMMVSVATGGKRIQEVNDYYIAREARLRERVPADARYANPHEDLWSWYRHWDQNFGRWAERRQYVRELFAPAIATLAKRSTQAVPEREPTGWERVDRALAKARAQFDLASAEEDFQAIGLLCREVIISAAQAVYDPALHETMDGIKPSATDANRMLEAYVGHVFPGDSYKEVRAHSRASLALALNLQHRRTATRQLAALCVEATASTVAVVSIIARGASPDLA